MNKYALITGASSGIGYHFAIKLDSLGYNTIIVARREERLKELAVKLINDPVILPYDLEDEDNCKNLLEKIKAYNIEIFINNAGLGDLNLFNDLTNYYEVPGIGKKCYEARVEMENMYNDISPELTLELFRIYAQMGFGREIVGVFVKK